MNWLLVLGVISTLCSLYRVWQSFPAGMTPIPTNQTQSVKIGEHSPINTPSDHAEFLTVLTAIAEDRILPEPAKTGGRAWAIAPDYRYLPPSTADSR